MHFFHSLTFLNIVVRNSLIKNFEKKLDKFFDEKFDNKNFEK
jgi:hypothetical protein